MSGTPLAIARRILPGLEWELWPPALCVARLPSMPFAFVKVTADHHLTLSLGATRTSPGLWRTWPIGPRTRDEIEAWCVAYLTQPRREPVPPFVERRLQDVRAVLAALAAVEAP